MFTLVNLSIILNQNPSNFAIRYSIVLRSKSFLLRYSLWLLSCSMRLCKACRSTNVLYSNRSMLYALCSLLHAPSLYSPVPGRNKVLPCVPSLSTFLTSFEKYWFRKHRGTWLSPFKYDVIRFHPVGSHIIFHTRNFFDCPITHNGIALISF